MKSSPEPDELKTKMKWTPTDPRKNDNSFWGGLTQIQWMCEEKKREISITKQLAILLYFDKHYGIERIL